jgi:hypothetical protein
MSVIFFIFIYINIIMKLMRFISLSALSAVLLSTFKLAHCQEQCLACIRQDRTSTLLVSFSFCESSDVCLQDEWNYIDMPCSSRWSRARSLPLDRCQPKENSCTQYTSSPDKRGVWDNHTETLGLGEYCVVTLDAGAFVGRVVIDDAVTVGAQYVKAPGNDTFNTTIKVGQSVEIGEGLVNKIYIFNGDTSGSITFTLAFRMALDVVPSLAFIGLAAFATLYA